MIYVLDILNDTDISFINETFDLSDFEQGETTSGLIIDLKNNLELSSTYELKTLAKHVMKRFRECSDFFGVVMPKHYSGMLFSKYEEGMYYNTHNDTYCMGEGYRTDCSITVFLNDPEEYDGGELVLTVGNQEISYKLKAGQCLIYPTGLKHRVNTVTSGIRKVCVMWVESCIHDIEIRNIMADFYLMTSKYGKDIYELLGMDAHHDIVNIQTRLMRKYGTFKGTE